MNGLPFLKRRKLPRIEQSAPETKLVNAGPEELIDASCSADFLEAVQKRDPRKLLEAIDALVWNAFDWNGNDGRED